MKTAQEAREKALIIEKKLYNELVKHELDLIKKNIEECINSGRFETSFFMNNKIYDENIMYLQTLGYEVLEITQEEQKNHYDYVIKW